MSTRFTSWINTVVSALTGGGLAAGDKIPVIDVSGTPATKYITPDELRQAAVFTDYYLQKLAGGASIENVGAIESNVNTVAATGATETLDLSLYAVHDVTMDQSCAFTFSNPAPSGKATVAVLIIRGAFTPSFTNTIIEPDNTALTYSTPSVWLVWTVDGGTSYFMSASGKAFA